MNKFTTESVKRIEELLELRDELESSTNEMSPELAVEFIVSRVELIDGSNALYSNIDELLDDYSIDPGNITEDDIDYLIDQLTNPRIRLVGIDDFDDENVWSSRLELEFDL
jgi:hypothetical protein